MSSITKACGGVGASARRGRSRSMSYPLQAKGASPTNLARKAKAADEMFASLVSEMNSAADVGVDSRREWRTTGGPYMADDDQVITDQYAIYLGDCVEVMSGLPPDCMHLSVYSPPFGGLYCYSSDVRDLSNSSNYEEFFVHYGHVVESLAKITMPGRMTAVHCADIPSGNSGIDHLDRFLRRRDPAAPEARVEVCRTILGMEGTPRRQKPARWRRD